MLYELILSYKATVPYIFIGMLAVFSATHWLFARKEDKSIPYKCPKLITYAQTGLFILSGIIGFLFLEANPALASLLVTSSTFMITGLASFIEGLYVGVNLPESKRQWTLYVDAAFSLIFGFAFLWIMGNWLEM